MPGRTSCERWNGAFTEDLEHAVVVALRELDRPAGDEDGGVVDEHVDGAVGLDRAGDELFAVLAPLQVRRDGRGLATGLADRLDDGVDGAGEAFVAHLDAARRDDDLCTGLREPARDGLADAPRGAGHDRYFAFEGGHVALSFTPCGHRRAASAMIATCGATCRGLVLTVRPSGSATGSRTVKTEPCPTLDSTSTVPSWAWTMPRTMASPSPVPPRSLRPLTKRSQTRGRSGAAMPSPVSLTATQAVPPSRPSETATVSPAEVWFERVAQQVADHAFDAVAVDRDGRRLGLDVELERHVVLASQRPHRVDDVRSDLDDGQGLPIEVDRAGVELGQFEQVLDQAVEANDVAFDAVEITRHVGCGDDAVRQRLDGGAHTGEWRSQVVRDGGGQLPTLEVEPLALLLGGRKLLREAIETDAEAVEFGIVGGFARLVVQATGQRLDGVG